jgi:hypothetical protein
MKKLHHLAGRQNNSKLRRESMSPRSGNRFWVDGLKTIIQSIFSDKIENSKCSGGGASLKRSR